MKTILKTAPRLKLALARNHMKQIDLAEKTGIPKSAISQYISGKVNPKQDKIYLMAKALNVTEAWLMGIEEDKPTISSCNITMSEQLNLTKQEETHIKKYRQLDADGKEDVDDYIDMKLAKLQRKAEDEELKLG